VLEAVVHRGVDFEAANVSIVGTTTTATTPPEQPRDAIFKQTALGWGVAYRALYGHLPLPEELDSVRMQFLKEDETTAAVGGGIDDDASCRRRGVLSNEDRLILTLLETIREDAYLIGDYLADVFINRAVPLKPFNELSHEEKTAYHSKLNCDICGLKFGEEFLANHGVIVKTRYKVRDHDHLQFARDDRLRDRFLLCQNCNLNLQNGVGSSRWLSYRYFLHNGSKYDFTILLRAIANLSDFKYLQYVDPACKVLKKTRLFRKQPRIFFGSEMNVLSISLFFNCSRMNSCPYCLLTQEEINDLRASGRQI
jgi:hypothetical protein